MTLGRHVVERVVVLETVGYPTSSIYLCSPFSSSSRGISPSRTHQRIPLRFTTLIIPHIAMKARALIKWELGPINNQKTISPFFTGLRCNKLFCLFLVIGTGKVYGLMALIMEGVGGYLSSNCWSQEKCILLSFLLRWISGHSHLSIFKSFLVSFLLPFLVDLLLNLWKWAKKWHKNARCKHLYCTQAAVLCILSCVSLWLSIAIAWPSKLATLLSWACPIPFMVLLPICVPSGSNQSKVKSKWKLVFSAHFLVVDMHVYLNVWESVYQLYIFINNIIGSFKVATYWLLILSTYCILAGKCK